MIGHGPAKGGGGKRCTVGLGWELGVCCTLTSWVAALQPRKNGAEPAGSGALAAASGRRAGGGTIAPRGQANRCAKFTLYFHICFEGENGGCKPKARALEIVQPRCGARSP